MKKLMIAAAIVCAAAMSQASMVNWGFTNKAMFGSTALGNQTVQLYMVGVGGADDVLISTHTTVQNPPVNKGKLLSAADGSSYKYNSTVAGGAVWNSEDGDLGRQYYIVMTTTQGDTDYTYTSSTVASSGLSDTSLGSVMFTVNSGTAESGTDAWVAAPEPTSGLLLLLGMAGLALKRKRA